MIPLKIQLKNFLSYGEQMQTVDFSCYQLICLSGKNGHGKSALLDAITWAIWGQARKPFGTAKADQALLRLGQTQMCVILDFVFNGQTYRIRREFAKTYGKPHAALDFGLLDTEKNEVLPLTDKTIRQTQAKIESLLNLDMESFVNSAFLRQGQSNEFSKKTAKERKEVLATILGLKRYESVRALALEKVKEATHQKQSLSTLQEKLALELQNKDALSNQINALANSLNAANSQELALHSKQLEYNNQKKELLEEHKKSQLVCLQIEQLESHDRELQSIIRTAADQWRSIHKKTALIGKQKELELLKASLLQALALQQQQLQQSLALKEKLIIGSGELQKRELTLKQEFTTQLNHKKIDIERHSLAKKALVTHEEAIRKQIMLYEQEKKTLEQKIKAADVDAKTYTCNADTMHAFERAFERRKEYYQKFIAQGTWIKNELDNLKQKTELVHEDDNPSCPLCEQNLSATRKRFLKKRFEDEEKFLTHRVQRLRKVSIALKAVLIEQHAQIAAHKKIASDGALALVQLTELATQLTKNAIALEIEYKNIVLHKEDLLTHEQQELLLLKDFELFSEREHKILQNDGTYTALYKQHQEIQTSYNALLYDAQKHQNLTKQLEMLEKELLEYSHLAEEIAQQAQRKNTVQKTCLQLKDVRKQCAELKGVFQTYTMLAQRNKQVEAHEQELHAQTVQLRKTKETLLQEKGSLERQQTVLVKYQEEYDRHVQLLGQLTDTVHDYQAIAIATGKDGIQALLIEEAIPEIEQEANLLLAKLTNNTAQIFIESLRDLKSGGTKETLDIKISDNVGIRPYELFSGGEAFRIDFALRIAISKLLARRAGTSLQTLIIDEGFGSQDEDGLGSIMDALYKIQEDFSKVIIVSHLPAMKDQFPVHFLIEKGPHGSSVRVMEQG